MGGEVTAQWGCQGPFPLFLESPQVQPLLTMPFPLISTSKAGLLSFSLPLLPDGVFYEPNLGSKTLPLIHILWESESVSVRTRACVFISSKLPSSTFVLGNEEQSRNQIRTVIPNWGWGETLTCFFPQKKNSSFLWVAWKL